MQCGTVTAVVLVAKTIVLPVILLDNVFVSIPGCQVERTGERRVQAVVPSLSFQQRRHHVTTQQQLSHLKRPKHVSFQLWEQKTGRIRAGITALATPKYTPSWMRLCGRNTGIEIQRYTEYSD